MEVLPHVHLWEFHLRLPVSLRCIDRVLFHFDLLSRQKGGRVVAHGRAEVVQAIAHHPKVKESQILKIEWSVLARFRTCETELHAVCTLISRSRNQEVCLHGLDSHRLRTSHTNQCWGLQVPEDSVRGGLSPSVSDVSLLFTKSQIEMFIIDAGRPRTSALPPVPVLTKQWSCS